jgi:hypothetical protein
LLLFAYTLLKRHRQNVPQSLISCFHGENYPTSTKLAPLCGAPFPSGQSQWMLNFVTFTTVYVRLPCLFTKTASLNEVLTAVKCNQYLSQRLTLYVCRHVLIVDSTLEKKDIQRLLFRFLVSMIQLHRSLMCCFSIFIGHFL